MNYSIINILRILAGVFLFVFIYMLCIQFFWAQLTIDLSPNKAQQTYLGLTLFAIHLTITVAALYFSISRDGISLRVIYWFYSFIFMGVAPLIQGGNGIWRFGFDPSTLLTLSSILLISHMFFIVGYNPSFRRWKRHTLSYLQKLEQSGSLRQHFFLDGKKVFLFSLLALIFSIATSLIYGFHFTSSIIREMFGSTYSPLESMVEFFVRPFIFFAFSFLIYAVINGDRRFICKLSLLFLFCSVFLIIGPLSGARSIVFFLYFGLFIILTRHKLKAYPKLFGGLLFAGVFGSELQNLARSFIFNEGNLALTGINYFFQGHFDGFEMIGHTINYVNSQGAEFGLQLLGAVLFWVPRSFWPGKSIGSGDFIAYEYLAKTEIIEYANFSMPLLGEAYLNFGIPGVCLIMFIVGWFCGKEDGKFHTRRRFETNLVVKQRSEPFWMWRYGVLLGLFLFLSRGDMQSSFAFGTGILLALVCSWLILHGRIKQRLNLV